MKQILSGCYQVYCCGTLKAIIVKGVDIAYKSNIENILA